MNILAIESSCDETAAAVLTEQNNQPVLLSNVVSSQIDIHKKYGGVVPEVAARAHIENIIPVISESLEKSKLGLSDIDYFAVTAGPGLIGSLVVGVETAKALTIVAEKPVIAVNHLEGHIYANFVGEVKSQKSKVKSVIPKFPIVALLVSGGHTMLILMRDHLKYEVIGQTRDDAAGEAFDKVAKVLGLGYPGGPEISKAAAQGDDSKYKFPIVDLTPVPKRGEDMFLKYSEPSLDFSFSGLKTAVITVVKTQGTLNKKKKADLAASFQKAVIDTLVQNSLRAVEKYKPKTFILSGGVAANKLLRDTLTEKIAQDFPDCRSLVPDRDLCTDNAGMMASAAYYRIKNKDLKNMDQNFVADPNLKLGRY